MMDKNVPAIFSIWKIFGFFIALAALGYKVYFTVTNYDSISEWWTGLIFLFFAGFITSLITAVNSFTRGMVTLIISLVIVIISMCLLGIDILCLLGFAASLDDASLIERGIFPLVNLLNIVASVFDLIGFFFIKKREKK